MCALSTRCFVKAMKLRKLGMAHRCVCKRFIKLLFRLIINDFFCRHNTVGACETITIKDLDISRDGHLLKCLKKFKVNVDHFNEIKFKI